MAEVHLRRWYVERRMHTGGNDHRETTLSWQGSCTSIHADHWDPGQAVWGGVETCFQFKCGLRISCTLKDQEILTSHHRHWNLWSHCQTQSPVGLRLSSGTLTLKVSHTSWRGLYQIPLFELCWLSKLLICWRKCSRLIRSSESLRTMHWSIHMSRLTKTLAMSLSVASSLTGHFWIRSSAPPSGRPQCMTPFLNTFLIDLTIWRYSEILEYHSGACDWEIDHVPPKGKIENAFEQEMSGTY